MPGSWRRFTGPLTRELVREPGRFGLGQVPKNRQPESTTTMVCGFCSTGCGLRVHLRNGEAVNVSADTLYPVNLGMACPKGWEALAPLSAADRAVTPLLRNDRGELEPVDWDQALKAMVSRFRTILEEHGPESVAFLSTGQITTEEMLMLGVLFKFGMGGIHGDANTRQCMATANVAYKQAFGFDTPPFTYKDFEESDVVVFIGANPCIAHPIMWERVMLNPHQPKIIVVDPRRTETAMAATHHYALAPKSDLTLLYGLAHILIRENWVDHGFIAAHTTGFESFSRHVRDFTPEVTAHATGISIGELEEFAAMIHQGKAVSFWWTMGVNQSHEAVRTAQAIIDLALITGNIGKPGTGANSITGQVNAMGSRLFSNTTSLPGGRDFMNARHRAEVAEILGIGTDHIPVQNSKAYDEIIADVCAGRIKGLWVVGTNPSHSWVDQNGLQKGLAQLECLVVQDMYANTDTVRSAHIVLPAAGWGEKEGTVINSERRIGLFKKVARAPGRALADFYIFRLVAEYWGCRDLFSRLESPEDAFQAMKRLSAGLPCDFSGIRDYHHIDERGGIQWPFRDFDQNGDQNGNSERRLFGDGRFFTADGKAKLIFDPVRPPDEPISLEYPFALLTGRGTSAQWHTNTRTAKSAVLRKLYPKECYVEMHLDDAKNLGIAPEDWVVVRTRRGAVRARAYLASTMQAGQIFLPMHYEGVNALTLSSFDPHSRQPSYKHCAARVEKPEPSR